MKRAQEAFARVWRHFFRREGVRLTVLNGLEAISAPVSALLVTGGLVRCLGATDYGLIIVALSLSALSLAITPAIAASTTKVVSEVIGRGDYTGRVASVIAASTISIFFIGAFILCAVVLLREPLSRLIFGSVVVSEKPEVVMMLVLAAMAVCIQQLDSTLGAVLKGLEKFRQQALFEALSRLSQATFVVFVGFYTADPTAVLISQCFTAAISALLRGVVVRVVRPEVGLFCRPRKEDFARIFGFGRWMSLNAVATLMYGSIDRVIVSRVLGPASAAEMNVYIQLAQLVHFVPNGSLAYYFPIFSRTVGQSDAPKQAIEGMYRRLRWLTLGIGVAMGIGILVFHPFMIRFFVGSSFSGANSAAMLLFLLSFTLLAFTIAPYSLLLGLGESKAISFVTMLSAMTAVGSAFILIPSFGLEGAAISRCIYAVGGMTLMRLARVKMQTI